MSKALQIDNVSQYDELVGHSTAHPLISVIDYSNVFPLTQRDPDIASLKVGIYMIFVKNDKHCEIKYGRRNYDYQASSLIFLAPGQEVSMVANSENYKPSGFALTFHPDLLRGTSLAASMKEYSYFSYAVNEALHVSDREKAVVLDCFKKIENELGQTIDKHSKKLIVSNIELLLNYCTRFYERQFVTREHAGVGILEKFEHLLNDYFESELPHTSGLPSVARCADELHLSANYLGDFVKKETGKSAQEYIHLKLLQVAKDKMFEPGKSLSEVAYELGFKYPQHFTRFFKQRVGMSPIEYRNLN